MKSEAWNDFAPTIVVGSPLAIKERGYGNHGYAIVKVERMTETQLVCSARGRRETRVRREDGKVIGETYTYAEPVTDGILSANKVQRFETWVRHYASPQLAKLELEQVEQVRELIERFTAENRAAAELAVGATG